MRVSIDGIDVDSTLAFDTGANYSVIDRTTARTHHVRILDDTIDVETITGKTKAVHIGVIPSLRIGAVTISNVIALVMEDADLDIPEARFHLTGLIGFPPLIAAGDATLFPDGRIVLYRRRGPVNRAHANLALQGVQPLLEVTAGTHNFVMSLDTGAGATFLYRGFLERAPELLRDARADSIAFGGVGNLARLTSISLSNVALRIAGTDVLVPKITALETRTSTASTYLDGNLGRDVLTRLGIVTLDFSSMRLIVR
jgi:aspartyl protease